MKESVRFVANPCSQERHLVRPVVLSEVVGERNEISDVLCLISIVDR